MLSLTYVWVEERGGSPVSESRVSSRLSAHVSLSGRPSRFLSLRASSAIVSRSFLHSFCLQRAPHTTIISRLTTLSAQCVGCYKSHVCWCLTQELQLFDAGAPVLTVQTAAEVESWAGPGSSLCCWCPQLSLVQAETAPPELRDQTTMISAF